MINTVQTLLFYSNVRSESFFEKLGDLIISQVYTQRKFNWLKNAEDQTITFCLPSSEFSNNFFKNISSLVIAPIGLMTKSISLFSSKETYEIYTQWKKNYCDLNCVNYFEGQERVATSFLVESQPNRQFEPYLLSHIEKNIFPYKGKDTFIYGSINNSSFLEEIFRLGFLVQSGIRYLTIVIINDYSKDSDYIDNLRQTLIPLATKNKCLFSIQYYSNLENVKNTIQFDALFVKHLSHHLNPWHLLAHLTLKGEAYYYGLNHDWLIHDNSIHAIHHKSKLVNCNLMSSITNDLLTINLPKQYIISIFNDIGLENLMDLCHVLKTKGVEKLQIHLVSDSLEQSKVSFLLNKMGLFVSVITYHNFKDLKRKKPLLQSHLFIYKKNENEVFEYLIKQQSFGTIYFQHEQSWYFKIHPGKKLEALNQAPSQIIDLQKHRLNLFEEFDLSNSFPLYSEYTLLRLKAGLSPVEESSTNIAFSNSLLCLTIRLNQTLVAMGRVIGDLGISVEIIDVIVDPDFQKKGLRKWLMDSLMTFIYQKTHDKVFVKIITEQKFSSLYQKYGFSIRNSEKLGLYLE